MEFKNGKIYTGEWINNKIEGKGRLTWPDRSYFEGEFHNDRKHGKGTLVFPDNSSYEGVWNFGKLHGLATFIKDGVAKKGEWNYG